MPTTHTNTETFFFRDSGQFNLLRRHVFPALIEGNRQRKELRIWSAGCSSGEEPYSIAILIRDQKLLIEDWRISIFASDINDDALARARRGRYDAWSFRGVPLEVREKYFVKKREGWQIQPRFQEMVEFAHCDLTRDPFPANIDLILCRNVFIYFQDESIRHVTDKFVDSLKIGGFLLTAHGELGIYKSPQLAMHSYPDSVVFTRIVPSGKTAPSPSIPKPARPKRAAVVVRKPAPAPRDLEGLARKAANAGAFEEAKKLCREILHLEPFAVRIYYLLSQIHSGEGDLRQAKTLLKRALYLDPAFVPACVDLALIQIQSGERKRARKLLESASNRLAELPDDAAVHDGISAAEMAQQVQSVLKTL